jgi:hypothetical protein
MNKTVRVTVTTEDGKLLDSLTLELPEGHRYVAVKPVNYSIGHNHRYQFEEIMTLPEKLP